jgi:hypothetical protein
MFKTYIENYNSKEYNEYLNLIPTLYEYKNIIANDSKSKTKGFSYNETHKEYNVKYKKFDVNVIKPIYIKIDDKIKILKDEKKIFIFEYNNLKYKIINQLNTESDFEKYDKVMQKLLKIDENIDDLIEYYKKVNLINLTQQNKNNEKIKEFNEQLNSLNKKFKNDVFKDDIEKNKSSSIYKKIVNEKNELGKNYYNVINYIIIEKPKIKYLNKSNKIIKKEDTPKKSKKSKEPQSNDEIMETKIYKLKEKIKKNNEKSDKPVQERIAKIEKKITDKFFAEFKFKNLKECSSGSHSEDYFTKKPEILKIINKYPEIKKILPKGFNKLPKNEICNELYKI